MAAENLAELALAAEDLAELALVAELAAASVDKLVVGILAFLRGTWRVYSRRNRHLMEMSFENEYCSTALKFMAL